MICQIVDYSEKGGGRVGDGEVNPDGYRCGRAM